jgi:predicted amidohydrolase
MSAGDHVTVACVQTSPLLGEVAINRSRIEEWLERGVAAGARLVVFPECALSGYMFDSLSEAIPHAEPIPGPSVNRFAESCKRLQIWMVVGLLELEGTEAYNSCVLIGPTGLISRYRKVHLPRIGVDRFTTPGSEQFSVEDAAGVKLGMQICYDGAFPEPTRVQALHGAELIVLPTNWASGAEPLAEHMMACRAMENVVYTMAVDRVGLERGTRFIGRSGIYDPLGRTIALASADQEQMLVVEIDLVRARSKRIDRDPGRAWFDRIADRRPEFYAALTRTDSIPPSRH